MGYWKRFKQLLLPVPVTDYKRLDEAVLEYFHKGGNAEELAGALGYPSTLAMWKEFPSWKIREEIRVRSSGESRHAMTETMALSAFGNNPVDFYPQHGNKCSYETLKELMTDINSRLTRYQMFHRETKIELGVKIASIRPPKILLLAQSDEYTTPLGIVDNISNHQFEYLLELRS